MNLQPNETRKLIYFYLAPDVPGMFQARTEISLGNGGDYTLFKTFDHTFTVVQDSQTLIEDILTILDTLPTSRRDRAEAQKASRLVKTVSSREIRHRKDILKNVESILEAIRHLRMAKDTDFSQVRDLLDDLLIIEQGMWHLYDTDARVLGCRKSNHRLANLPNRPGIAALPKTPKDNKRPADRASHRKDETSHKIVARAKRGLMRMRQDVGTGS